MDWLLSFWHGLAQSYGSFFSWDARVSVVTDPVSLGNVGTLVVLEGLLSADNALVLAIVVKNLPEHERKRALFFGIWGAYLFRFLAIGFGVYLVQIRWVKILGALYLLWMVVKHFFFNQDDDDQVKSPKSFWGTVLQVELMDIAFSIDSVLAAFGVSDKIWVLFLGAIFGILMMRGVAQIFLKLIEKYPELESTAYFLIGLIGLKMMGSAFGLHVPDLLFFSILIIVFAATFIVHNLKNKKHKNKDQNEQKVS